MKKSFFFFLICFIITECLQAQVVAYINFAENTSDGITMVVENNPVQEAYTESANISGVACRRIPVGKFLYLRVDKSKVPSDVSNLIFKITYYGNNTHKLWFNYNSSSGDYQVGDFEKAKADDWVTTTVAVTNANLRGNMNGGSDIRMGHDISENFIKEVTISFGTLDPEVEKIPDRPNNPASEFRGKSLAGYQVWHRAGNTDSDWVHWSYGRTPAPGLNKNVFVCGWPDISEYPDDILFNTNFAPLGNGQPARLYSSNHPFVINKHFDWMEAAGFDGVAVQRFVGGIGKAITEGNRIHLDEIRDAAERTNRLFYICYDLNYFGPDILECLKNDWVYEIEQSRALTSSPNYATVDGKPVVEIWGIGYFDIDADKMGKIIRFFHDRGCYVIAGVPREWRNAMWGRNYQSVYNALDCISPWTVGVYGDIRSVYQYYDDYMIPDVEYCRQNGIDFLPVCIAGSGNWVNANLTLSTTDRLGGNLLWTEIQNVKQLGLNSVYFAMFDEFEENTQLMNTAVDYFDIPTDEYFETLAKDGVWVSSDYYLKLAAAAAKLLRNEIEDTPEIPVSYSLGPTYFRNSFESRTTTFYRKEGNSEYIINNKTMNIDPCFYKNRIVQSNGVSNASCSIVQDNIHKKSGLYAAKLSGTANEELSFYAYQTNETKIEVKDGMKLSYYKYPANELGKNATVDLIFSDGAKLSYFNDYEKSSGTVGVGENVEITFGIPGITGKIITGIALRFEGGTGPFEAYFDDIFIEDGNGDVGIGKINSEATNIYANNGNIFFDNPSKKNVKLLFYDLSGKLVHEGMTTSNSYNPAVTGTGTVLLCNIHINNRQETIKYTVP